MDPRPPIPESIYGVQRPDRSLSQPVAGIEAAECKGSGCQRGMDGCGQHQRKKDVRGWSGEGSRLGFGITAGWRCGKPTSRPPASCTVLRTYHITYVLPVGKIPSLASRNAREPLHLAQRQAQGSDWSGRPCLVMLSRSWAVKMANQIPGLQLPSIPCPALWSALGFGNAVPHLFLARQSQVASRSSRVLDEPQMPD